VAHWAEADGADWTATATLTSDLIDYPEHY
jgi:hypothetical protein